jgi:hypothetical protein
LDKETGVGNGIDLAASSMPHLAWRDGMSVAAITGTQD